MQSSSTFIILFAFKDGNTTGSLYLCHLLRVLIVIIESGAYIQMCFYIQLTCTDGETIYLYGACYWILHVCYITCWDIMLVLCMYMLILQCFRSSYDNVHAA